MALFRDIFTSRTSSIFSQTISSLYALVVLL
jgi:hypothetical protein